MTAACSSSVTAKCMVCGTTVVLDVDWPDIPMSDRAWIAASQHNWAMGNGEYGILLCCPDCYPKAFDTSVGSVGRVRPEYMKFAWRKER